jgi:hypothetical protein
MLEKKKKISGLGKSVRLGSRDGLGSSDGLGPFFAHLSLAGIGKSDQVIGQFVFLFPL